MQDSTHGPAQSEPMFDSNSESQFSARRISQENGTPTDQSDASERQPPRVPVVMNVTGEPNIRKGRPRDEAAHQAILECTRALALSGTTYKDITIEAIANGSKVAKSTIYRWWKTKAEIVFEACLCDKAVLPMKPTLLEDLQDLVRQEVHIMSTSMSRTVYAGFWAEFVAMDAASGRPRGQLGCPYAQEKHTLLHSIFERARTRAEWRGEADISAAYEALLGPIFYRMLACGELFDEDRVQRVARNVLVEATGNR